MHYFFFCVFYNFREEKVTPCKRIGNPEDLSSQISLTKVSDNLLFTSEVQNPKEEPEMLQVWGEMQSWLKFREIVPGRNSFRLHCIWSIVNIKLLIAAALKCSLNIWNWANTSCDVIESWRAATKLTLSCFHGQESTSTIELDLRKWPTSPEGIGFWMIRHFSQLIVNQTGPSAGSKRSVLCPIPTSEFSCERL